MRSHLLYPAIESDLPIISYGKGATLIDADGKDYIDGSSGVMIANIGHGREEIAKIAYEQIKNIAFSYRSQFKNNESEKLAKKLVNLAKDKSHAFFLNSGSEANDAAIRVALQYWQELGFTDKKIVIGREISNHGNTIATLSIAENKRRDEIDSITLDIAENKIPACYCYRCPYQLHRSTCAVECATALEGEIKKLGSENVAAFIAEPVTATAGGVLIPHEKYFKMIRKICDKYQVLLIVDEIVTGLGRTGKWFGMQQWNISADISVLGKGLNAGYTPLSAILINKTIVEAISSGSHNLSIGHTHSCNPLSSAVANGVIDYLIDNDVIEQVETKGNYIKAELLRLYDKFSIIGDVRSIGLLSAIEFVADRKSKRIFPKEAKISDKVKKAALNAGLVIYPCRGLIKGEKGDAILIAPPLNTTQDELEKLICRLEKSIEQVSSEVIKSPVLK